MSLARALKKTLSDARFISGLIAAASVAALGAAFTAQYGFGLTPCPLCIFQRIPYALTALLGLAGLVLAARGRGTKGAAALAALAAPVFLAGALIAFYHSGVEQHWWQSAVEGCKVTFDTQNTGSLLAKIESLGAAPCDQIAWVDPVFGLSMAVWNMIASAALSAISLAGAILIARRANGVLSL